MKVEIGGKSGFVFRACLQACRKYRKTRRYEPQEARDESRDWGKVGICIQGMPSGMPQVSQNARAFRRWVAAIYFRHGLLAFARGRALASLQIEEKDR